MSIDLSLFGQRLCQGSGIEELMEDLGNALSSGGPDIKMLGGGQPASIPEMNASWRRRMEEIAEEAGGMEKSSTEAALPLCSIRFPYGHQ